MDVLKNIKAGVYTNKLFQHRKTRRAEFEVEEARVMAEFRHDLEEQFLSYPMSLGTRTYIWLTAKEEGVSEEGIVYSYEHLAQVANLAYSDGLAQGSEPTKTGE